MSRAAGVIDDLGFLGDRPFSGRDPADGVDVSEPGHVLRVAWAPAAGATAAQLDSATLRVGPVTLTASLGALAIAPVADETQVEVTVPGGQRLRSLTLAGLQVDGGSELLSGAALAAQVPPLHLAVSTLVNGSWTPLCVVPNLAARGVLPGQLRGANYANGVLRLPDPAEAKLRLGLVEGEFPEGFTFRQTRLASAHGTAALPSADLELLAPDGSEVWAFAGELPSAQTVDLRVAIMLALEEALAAGSAPDISFRLRGRGGTRARATLSQLRGALVRAFPGVLRTQLQGAAEELVLAAPALAPQAPASATADLAVSYAGVRLHDAVRDELPVHAGDVSGPVIGETPVVRVLPVLALRDHAAARVAPIGRAPEDCALSAELVDLGAGPPGTPLAPPGTLELEASDRLQAHWIELPDSGPLDRPTGVALRATSGRFLWAAGANGAPLLRMAVHDPDPGGRPVWIGDTTLLALDAPQVSVAAAALPGAALRGPVPPRLHSDLFCTVDLADLTLRYAR